MKILKILLYVFGGIIALFLLITIFLPSKLHVERSIEINAPASVVYDVVNNTKAWEDWSPWKEMDPKMAVTYAGPENGVGASYSWKSENSKLGEGKLIITKTEPNKLVEYDMYMFDKKGGSAPFTMLEKDGKTTLTWSLNNDLGFFEKWFGVIAGPMLGPIYEKGLKNLKVVAEKNANLIIPIEVIEIKPRTLIAVADSASMDSMEIGAKYGKAFGELMACLAKNKIKFTPYPIAITNSFDTKGFTFDAALIVPNAKLKTDGRVRVMAQDGGKVVMAIYTGPYDKVMPAYNAIMKYIKDNKLNIRGKSWEEYINDPMTTAPDKLITHIYFPV